MNQKRPPQELPVDVSRKSEIVQNRIGTILILGVLGVLVFFLFLMSVNFGFVLAKGASALPDIRLLEDWRPNQSTRIFDRKGNLIANIHGDEDRVVVPLSEISPNIQRAVMAIEDNRFYQHDGVDIRGTFRALMQNVRGGDVQGGSTLTQQLVKNLFLTPERSMGRKLAEALLALRVERYYDKNKILEMYLNQVYWGNQAYGIEKAARRYFRKPASDLTVAESALLAGLLKAPEGLSPFAYPKAARKRQIEVLDSMLHYGYITPQQREDAVHEQIVLNDRRPRPSKHPYYVTYVIQELVDRFGEDAVRRGGLKVYTALDPDVQTAAEESLVGAITKLPKYSQVTQGALVAMDLNSSEIIALVGGTDFVKSQFNNAIQARRAPGSTFKPIVYLTGFRLGMITPETPISDRPVHFNTGVSIWSPHNWDGRYMGPMTIRKALTLSRNTTTVQVGMKVGIDEVIKTARLAGITSRIDPNFSSLLGSSGISPLEMATVYATFARGGVWMQPTAIRQIEDMRGRVVALDNPPAKRVFDTEPISELVSILLDVVEKGTGKNARLPGRVVAGKTGTTDHVRDIWFSGFTPDMVATVWMGNEKYVPLRGVFSSNTAQVWHDFAQKYYEITNLPVQQFAFMPEDGAKPRVARTQQEQALEFPGATPQEVPVHEGPSPPAPLAPPSPAMPTPAVANSPSPPPTPPPPGR